MIFNIGFLLFIGAFYLYFTRGEKGIFSIAHYYYFFGVFFGLLPLIGLILNGVFYLYSPEYIYRLAFIFYSGALITFFFTAYFDKYSLKDQYNFKRFKSIVFKIGFQKELFYYTYFTKNAGNKIILNEPIDQSQAQTIANTLRDNNFKGHIEFYLKGKLLYIFQK